MPKLTAEKRDINIKPTVLRDRGELPAVFYGRKTKSTPILIKAGEFTKVWKEAGESTIIDLAYGGEDVHVLIQDIALDPVRDVPIHVDFYVIEADRPVEVKVPVEFTGEAPALKEEGATVVKVLYEIEIKGLPKNLPQQISVDLSSLKVIDDQIAAKDIALPEGLELITKSDEIVAAISVAAEEEEEAPVEEFDASAIEAEQKGKAEGGEEESGVSTEEKSEGAPTSDEKRQSVGKKDK